MNTKNFKKLSTQEQENSYGGWAWLATAIPLVLQTIMTGVSAFKMLESDKGSVKYDGADAHWDNHKPSVAKTAQKEKIFFGF